MKELETKNKPEIGVHQNQNQKQEYKFIGDIVLKTGCKLFAYNPEEDEMKEIVIEKKASISISGDTVENRKAQYNPKYTYFQAINEKNARRKLEKYRKGLHEIAETFEKKKFESLPQLF